MPQLLHHNHLGYVAYCCCSRLLHVCFGTVAIAATPAEYEELQQYVGLTMAHERQLAAPDADLTARRIVLRTPAARLALVLTRAELAALEHLLDTSGLVYEARQLTGQFDPGPDGVPPLPDLPIL